MSRIWDGAIDDLHSGLKMRRVWMALAHEDIGDQHRRTLLGPIWLLLNYLAFAGTFIFVFHRGELSPSYAPYVATGLLVWFYIMEVIAQSASLFPREESFIKGTTLPLSVYVMRLTMQSVIRAGYALAGCAVILIFSGISVTPAWTWSVLALALIVAITPAIVIIFAILGAFLPDSQYVVSNAMRIGMFLTPVFWVYDNRGHGIQHAFYYWNPFTYFLEIVRVPILTGEVPAHAFIVCLLMGAAAWASTIAMLGYYRKKIVFVL